MATPIKTLPSLLNYIQPPLQSPNMTEFTSSFKSIFCNVWREKRIFAISFGIAFAQFQYGFDSSAVSGFQSMVGFLKIFGYEDVRCSNSIVARFKKRS